MHAVRPLALLGLLALFVAVLPSAMGVACGADRSAGAPEAATATSEPAATPPPPAVALDAPGEVHQGIPARLAGSARSTVAGDLQVRIDFGDGVSATATAGGDGAFAFEHTYLAAGPLHATVEVTGPTGTGRGEAPVAVIERRIVFVQGMNSESGCPGGRHFLDRAPEWVGSALAVEGPMRVGHADAAFFSYSGKYCGGAGAVAGAAPDYGEGDTCASIDTVTAPRLRALVDALAPAKVTVIAHSMGGLVTAYLAASDPSWARERIASVVTFDSPLGGIDTPRAEILGLAGMPDGGCGRGSGAMDDLRAGSGVTRAAAAAASVVPLFTIDGVSGEDAALGWREAVPGGRTSLPNEAAHLEVAEGHSEIWTRAPSGSGAAKAGIIACALVPSAPCRLPAN